MILATDLLSKAVAKPIEEAAKSMAEKTKDYFVDREIKDQIDVGLAYEEYLAKVYDSYSKSITILYDKPEKISSFFAPVDLQPLPSKFRQLRNEKYSLEKDKDRISTKDLSKLLEQGNKLIITGTGGMGKTMLMKHFCSNAIENNYKIPVFISLRRFNNVNFDDKPFEKLIYEQLKTYGFELDYNYFEYSLASDRYLFLFDGYDEINDAKRVGLSFFLSDFANRYSKNSFIISSRMIDGLNSLNGFSIFSICPLTIEQTVDLIWMLDYEEGLKKRFTDELTGKLYDKYKSFASIPLLLSILFLTHATNRRLPETLNEFYEKAFEALCFRFDRKVKGFERDFKSGLTYQAFRNAFIRFCFITYFKEMYSFSYQDLADILPTISQKMKKEFSEDAYINDLVNISCMLIHDGQEYIFLHRSFQEYFAAVFVAKKNDSKQRGFISEFINSLISLNEGDIFHPSNEFLFNTEYQDFSGDRVLDFLVMLQSVEPDRFDSIVIFPIINKIYDLYQKQNKDLFLTLIKSSVAINELAKRYLNTKYTIQKSCVSNSEMKVMEYFYSDLGIRLIEKNNPKLYQLLANSLFCSSGNVDNICMEHGIDNTTRGYRLFWKWIRYYSMAILHYEMMSKQQNPHKNFDEFINDFI